MRIYLSGSNNPTPLYLTGTCNNRDPANTDAAPISDRDPDHDRTGYNLYSKLPVHASCLQTRSGITVREGLL